MADVWTTLGFDEYAALSVTDPVLHLRLPMTVGQRMEAMFERWRLLELQRIRRNLAATPDAPPRRLSVVMPARDRAHTLHRPILSLRQQLDVDIELILVDDASSDGTAARAEELAGDLDLKVIRLPDQKGQSFARNVGIEAASSEFVAFLDADDWWDAAFGLIMTTALVEQQAIPVCTQRLLRPMPHLDTFRYGLVSPDLLANRNAVSVSAFVAPRAMLLDVGGFPEDLRMYEDWVVAARLARVSEFHAIPAVLSVYDTTSAASVSKADSAESDRIALETARTRVLDELARHPSRTGALAPRTAQRRSGAFRTEGWSRRAIEQRGCTIVVVSFEQGSLLRRCLEALERTTGPEDADILVVDNGSTSPETLDVLAEASARGRCTVIHLPTNGGFSAAVNRAHRAVASDRDLLVMNNDVIVTPGWLPPLRERAADPTVGLVLPSQLVPPEFEDSGKHVPSRFEGFDVDVTRSEHARNVAPADLRRDAEVELRFAPLFCALIPAEVRQIGLPLRGGLHYDSDRFFADVIRLWADYRIVREPRSEVLHLNVISGRAVREGRPHEFQRLIDGWPLTRSAARSLQRIADRGNL